MLDQELPVHATVTSVHERRVTVRYALQRSVFCQQGIGRSDLFWRFGKVLDLSVGGIRLTLNRGFDPGTMLLVELANADASFWVTMPARIIHATQEGSNWNIGCAFETALAPDELNKLL